MIRGNGTIRAWMKDTYRHEDGEMERKTVPMRKRDGRITKQKGKKKKMASSSRLGTQPKRLKTNRTQRDARKNQPKRFFTKI